MKQRCVTIGIAAAAWAALVACAAAQIVVVPPDLAPGASYRLVFVTSQTRTAAATDIADYNAFVTASANSQPLLAALGTTWKAMGSTLTVDAAVNTETPPTPGAGFPFYRLDGARVAANNGALWNTASLENTISFTELGTRTPLSIQTPPQSEAPWVWTGSTSGGTKSPSAYLGAANNFPVAAVAYNTASGPYSWIGLATSHASDVHAVYGMSGVLTVPGGGSFLEADFDEDQKVDADDLVKWTAGFATLVGATHMQGDANADGAVDGADLLVWQKQLGSSALAAVGAPVPEPVAGVLGLIAWGVFLGRRSVLSR